MPRTKITDDYSDLSPVERALKNYQNACHKVRNMEKMRQQHQRRLDDLRNGKITGTDVELSKQIRKEKAHLEDADEVVGLTTREREDASDAYAREYVAAAQAEVGPAMEKRIQDARKVGLAAVALGEALNELHEDEAELRRIARTTINAVNSQQHISWVFNMIHNLVKFQTPYAGGGAFNTPEEFPERLSRYDSEKLERMTAERCEAEARTRMASYLETLKSGELAEADKPEVETV